MFNLESYKKLMDECLDFNQNVYENKEFVKIH